MTQPRVPKGTPKSGGQFTFDRKPDGGDLSEPPSTLRMKIHNETPGEDIWCWYEGEDFDDVEAEGRWLPANDVEGAKFVSLHGDTGKVTIELGAGVRVVVQSIDLDFFSDNDEPPINHETGAFTYVSHTYQFEKTGPQNGVTNYTLTNDEGGGGWRFEYDGLTRRAKAHGVAPVNPSAEWRDRGEADIRSVVRLFEPNVKLLNLDGDTYLIGGDPWPLSRSHLSGISTGEMMLIGGKFDDDGLRRYIAQQRSDIDKSEAERPDMKESFAETRRYIDGIEIAADLGRDAAMAGTVGAMNERFGEMSS